MRRRGSGASTGEARQGAIASQGPLEDAPADGLDATAAGIISEEALDSTRAPHRGGSP